MYERTQVLVDGFAALVLYVDHLSHCISCLNERGGNCEKRLRLLYDCSETLRPLRRGLAVEYHQIIQALSGLKFSHDLKQDLLEKLDVSTFHPTEPEPTGPRPA